MRMPDYSTPSVKLQVVNLPDSTGKSREYHVNPDTGMPVEPLRDSKFPWAARKRRTFPLADAYRGAGYNRLADRALGCSTALQYLASADGEQRRLSWFNACQLRLCPLCSARRAKILARRLTKILAKIREDHPDTQLLFLTLTMRNVPGDKLRDALDLLTDAWHKLIRRRPVDRAILGTFRAIEITRNRETDEYHPHIHAIVVVENAYFDRKAGLYLTKDKWIDMWQQSLKAGYRPSVDIRSTYKKGSKGKPSKGTEAAVSAALEAAKYATKDTDFIGSWLPPAEAAAVVRTYTEALAYKRMIGMSGVVKEIAAQLKLEEMEDVQDLIHADEDEVTGLTRETAALLEDYGWHYGLAEHILVNRFPNPDCAAAVRADDTGEMDVFGDG